MTKTARQSVFALSAILACALLVLAGGVDAFRQLQSPAISSQQHSRSLFVDNSLDLMNSIRGGSIDVEIESSDEEETDDEEEEVSTLAKSAKKATTKAVKKKVTVAMTAKPTRKKPSSLGTFFKVPYILKACLNPFVFWQMTAGYWKSLYNINYMAENTVTDTSQNLRSALEQKARATGGGGSKGRRKMKPGQAKSLSDLPALNT